MIRISKTEAKYLNKNGIRYGENGIFHTVAHHKSYYLTESKRNLKKLDEYRKSLRKDGGENE